MSPQVYEAEPMALCHEWLTTFGGAEQVSSRIAHALGIRDIYAAAADPTLARSTFSGQRIQVHPWGLTKVARRHWQWMLPIMPTIWSKLDLSKYRTVITSSHACTNAIRLPATSYHISYCHSPMRYAWEWKSELGRIPRPVQSIWPAVASFFRNSDKSWAKNVTLFIANSNNVAARIRRYYARSAVVIYPPIDTSFWTPDSQIQRERSFLVAGRLVSYKRPDVAVAAATMAGERLVVAGFGPELAGLKRRAGPTVEFIAHPSSEHLRELYRRATALVYPGVEDFGMTMVEAQACGTPVIAFDSGGAREAVDKDTTGLLYRDSSPRALANVLRNFEPERYTTSNLRTHAARFHVTRFDREILHVIESTTRESVSVAATDDFAERLQEDLHVERE